MKATISNTTLTALVLASLTAGITGGCASSESKPRVRVTEETGYIQINHLPDGSVTRAFKISDAMTCRQCKTVWYQTSALADSSFADRLRQPQGPLGDAAFQDQQRSLHNWAQQHYCPGCKSTITTTGTWRNRKETVNHSCNAIGEDSAVCCVAQNEAMPTSRMGQKDR